MTQHIDPCDTARNNVIAAGLALQQCTKTAANIVDIPGKGQIIAIGTKPDVARLLELVPAAATTQASTAQAEPAEYEQDLLDIVRSFCNVAQRLTELTPAQRENYPSPLSPWSPLFQAASVACVERGYTEWGLAIEGVTYPSGPDAATSSTDSALADAEARDAVLEEVADALELLNDPAGDAAAYDNRDMNGYELERMNAIQHCVNTVLALRSATATGSGG